MDEIRQLISAAVDDERRTREEAISAVSKSLIDKVLFLCVRCCLHGDDGSAIGIDGQP